MRRIREDGKALMKDERGVSAVIGVILMIAITVIIAAVVAAFAYGIIGGVTKAPNAALVMEDARAGSYNFTIVHHGGDAIIDAFKSSGTDPWHNLEVRLNGATITNSTAGFEMNGNTAGISGFTADFKAGDQVEIGFTTRALQSGDTITIVYVPTGDVLQRIKVS